MAEPLIRVENLCKHFQVGRDRILKAVDGVSFTIDRRRTLGLVGESGCGKTTVGRTLMRLYEPDGGRVLFEGRDVFNLSRPESKALTRRMQMIFQDPYASLNPYYTVEEIVSEGMRIHKMYKTRQEYRDRVFELLETVGLHREHASRFPHEFSGGQRQRVGIARALALNPEFIVCDEPISALDVSIQAQVINMLEDLQREMGITYLFVSHDLSMVRHISHRVGVMYLGHLVEVANVHDLYADMRHPYTRALLSAVPVADPDLAANANRIILQGDVPTPIDPPSGCPFRTRCRFSEKRCAETRPELREVAPGHLVACHLV